MATTSTGREHNRIQLVFRGRYEEAPTGGTSLYPGMLAYIDDQGRIRPHNLVGGGGECLIVDLDLKRGMTVDDVYSAAIDQDVIPHLLPLPGDVLAVLLQDGEAAVKGSGLTSNGDGTFKVAADNDQQMFIAWETKTASGNTLIKARCISTHAKTEESSL